MRVWNPSIRQYSTYNGKDAINGGTQYIGPGQAFFIQSTGTEAFVNFTEPAKMYILKQVKPLYNTIMAVNNDHVLADNIGINNVVNVDEKPLMIRAKFAKIDTENSDETLIILKSGELAQQQDTM